ncbi:unnamed protein product [Cochlearia groenlandica]
MASMPLYSQRPPPPPSSGHSSSVGPFIAVLIIVIFLCILATVIGRLCSGKTIMGYGDYDMERWAETRCSSCIDGHIFPTRPSPPQGHVADPEEKQETNSDNELPHP